MIFLSKNHIMSSLNKIMSRDIERARRFIVTGGPGRVQYGLTPRSTRQDLLDWNQRLQSEARRRELRERLKAASGLDGSNNGGPVNRQEEDHPSNNHTE